MRVAEYIEWCESWGASGKTCSTRHYILTAFARDTMSSDDPDIIESWIFRPALSDWSRATYHTTLRTYFAWEVQKGLREANPVERIRRPRRPRKTPRPFSPSEVRTIFAAEIDHPHLRTWFTLGIFAGLRAHEVAKLRGEDVSDDVLYIVGKGQKVAYIPVHERVAEALADYPRRGLLFGVVPKTVSNQATKHLKQLGIDGSFHRCRHTFGTSLLRSGSSIRTVQELMRHESITSTEIYTLVTDADRRRAIASMAA